MIMGIPRLIVAKRRGKSAHKEDVMVDDESNASFHTK